MSATLFSDVRVFDGSGAPSFAGRGDPLVIDGLRNYLLSAAGGTAWYLQFFFYTMGESQVGA
jgi:L-rhamnose-H+ transport protein